jgi:hypothetical protein
MPDLSRSETSRTVDGKLLHRVSRMTPDGRWVWAWQSRWHHDTDEAEGRSIPENDAIQQAAEEALSDVAYHEAEERKEFDDA